MSNLSPQAQSHDPVSGANAVARANDVIQIKAMQIDVSDVGKVVASSTLSHHGSKSARKELQQLAENGTIHGWTVGISSITQLDDFVAFFNGPIESPYRLSRRRSLSCALQDA